MIDALDRARAFTSAILETGLQTVDEIKSGFLVVFSADGSYMLWRMYSLDGFEKWTKVVIFNLEFLSLIPEISAIFKKFRITIDGQKDLNYASMTFLIFASLIEMDDQGNPVGFQLPRFSRKEGGGINWLTVWYCCAAVCDTAQFFKKYGIADYAWYSKYVSSLGVYCHLNQIPVVQSIFDEKPREFFLVLAGIVELYRGSNKGLELWNTPEEKRGSYWTLEKWEVILQVSSSLSKIIGIGLYRQYKGQLWLGAVGLIMCYTSLFKFMLSSHRRRLERNEFPAPPMV